MFSHQHLTLSDKSYLERFCLSCRPADVLGHDLSLWGPYNFLSLPQQRWEEWPGVILLAKLCVAHKIYHIGNFYFYSLCFVD